MKTSPFVLPLAILLAGVPGLAFSACAAQKDACIVIREANAACVMFETASGERVPLTPEDIHHLSVRIAARSLPPDAPTASTSSAAPPAPTAPPSTALAPPAVPQPSATAPSAPSASSAPRPTAPPAPSASSTKPKAKKLASDLLRSDAHDRHRELLERVVRPAR